MERKNDFLGERCTMVMDETIIDFHTHAFPDHVAAHAIPCLEEQGNVKACHAGRIDSLLKSMDNAAVQKSVICSIATKPTQYEAILAWSQQIRSERIIPFPSVHPDDPNILNNIARISAEGFVGIKMHPYYQEFYLNEKRLVPIFDQINNSGLILMMHTGYDIAFPRERRADPATIVRLVEQFPDLKLVTSHFGAWDQWDEVEQIMLGRPIYMDISFALEFLPQDRALAMLARHPMDYLLFGSDSPWCDQKAVVEQIKGLGLTRTLESALLGGNAMRLLASAKQS